MMKNCFQITLYTRSFKILSLIETQMQDVRSRPKTSSKPRVETIRVSHYSVPRSISLGSVSSLTLPLAIISSEMSLSSLSKVQCLGCCVVEPLTAY